MVGSPQHTNEGVNVKCLLNPLLKINGRVHLNESDIQRLKIDLNISDPKQIANSIAPPLASDGVYYILVVEHIGDTRGNDWYSNLVTLNTSVSSNPRNSVQVNYGSAS